MYQVARHAAGAGQEPEDLVQETYLRAYAAFGSFRGANTRAWLAAICLNAARSQARRRRRRLWEVPAQALLDALPLGRADSGDAVPDVADMVIAGLDAQAVSRCLALLPEPQRVCIVLMDVAGYTARETAEALGCPRGTVLARVHRGQRRLAQLLAEAGVSYGGHDRLLAAFLAGDLDAAEVRRWDEHLLECERCWRAVREDRAGRQAAQVLRQPAPPGAGRPDRLRR